MSFGQNNGLNFGMADLYPNMGFTTTRSLTVPEADDQHSLVDHGEKAEEAQPKHNPATSKAILIGVGVFIAAMVLLAWKG